MAVSWQRPILSTMQSDICESCHLVNQFIDQIRPEATKPVLTLETSIEHLEYVELFCNIQMKLNTLLTPPLHGSSSTADSDDDDDVPQPRRLLPLSLTLQPLQRPHRRQLRWLTAVKSVFWCHDPASPWCLVNEYSRFCLTCADTDVLTWCCASATDCEL